MQFTVNREQIFGPLNRVNTVIDRQPSIPILSQILLQAENDNITLTGSNIEIEISETITGVDIQGNGKFTFPGRSVLEFCRRLPDNCNLKFEIDDSKMTVSKVLDARLESSEDISTDASDQDKGQSAFHTTTQEPHNFPKLDAGQWDIQFQIARSDLAQLIQRTQHAMGQNDIRFYLNAMMFEIGANELRTVTTDGHRMATTEVQVSTGLAESTHRAIVPRKTALDLGRLLSEISSQVSVELNANHIRVRTNRISFTSKLLEGQYPDWRGAIPVNLSRVFRSNRVELSSVLRRVDILSDSKTGVGAKFSVDDSALKVNAKNPLQEINEKLDVEHIGEPIKFNVNCRYLLDIFDAMSENDVVEFNLSGSDTACLIRFPDEETTTFLVMLLQD